MLKIEPFEIHSVVNGTVRLDGGAMFGVVPKVLWEKVADPDDRNRILLATRTLLAIDRSQGRVILVDTGCGSKWESKAANRYGVQVHDDAIPKALKDAGLSTDDVTDVIVSHLHFDHNGGLTRWYDQPGGRMELCYPGARHWVHRKHWEHAGHAHPKDRGSFVADDFRILEESDRVTMVEGDEPTGPFAGVEWLVSHGHTPFQLHPIFGEGDRKLLFAGDLVPTVAHLRLAWIMAFDVRPLVTIEEKQRIYTRCLNHGLLLAFPHDPKIAGVSIGGTVERPIVVEPLPL